MDNKEWFGKNLYGPALMPAITTGQNNKEIRYDIRTMYK